jgi:hypothetical protein
MDADVEYGQRRILAHVEEDRHPVRVMSPLTSMIWTELEEFGMRMARSVGLGAVALLLATMALTVRAYQYPQFEAKLLPAGKVAPDFNLPMLRGGQLSLTDARRGKKAVLVNFWFYN